MLIGDKLRTCCYSNPHEIVNPVIIELAKIHGNHTLKSLRRTLPSNRPRREVVIPTWLKGGAEARLRADPTIQTVLLFGSRASGRYLDESDWDVCFIHTERYRNEDAKDIASWHLEEQVQEIHIWNRKFKEKQNIPHSFPHAIGQHYRLLAGTPIKDFETMVKHQPSREDLVMHLTYAYLHLVHAVTYLTAPPDDRPFSPAASTTSADAAERAAKALCCVTNSPYDLTHNVAKLAEVVPSEWHETVMALNGDTGEHHVSSYEFDYQYETIAVTEQRCRVTSDLLDFIVDNFQIKLTEHETEIAQGILKSYPTFLSPLEQPIGRFKNDTTKRVLAQVIANLRRCFGIDLDHKSDDSTD